MGQGIQWAPREGLVFFEFMFLGTQGLGDLDRVLAH